MTAERPQDTVFDLWALLHVKSGKFKITLICMEKYRIHRSKLRQSKQRTNSLTVHCRRCVRDLIFNFKILEYKQTGRRPALFTFRFSFLLFDCTSQAMRRKERNRETNQYKQNTLSTKYTWQNMQSTSESCRSWQVLHRPLATRVYSDLWTWSSRHFESCAIGAAAQRSWTGCTRSNSRTTTERSTSYSSSSSSE